MKSIPVVCEIYETDQDGNIIPDMPAGQVKAFDECTVEIKIDTVFNLSSWKEFSREVEQCIENMELEDD